MVIYCTRAQEKVWQTIQKNLVNKLKSVYIFGVSVNIGEGNFGEWLTICQFFPYQNFPTYGMLYTGSGDCLDTWEL